MNMSPGWYQDPLDQSRQRYWDGQAWTEQVAAAPPAPPTQPLLPPPATPSPTPAAFPTPQQSATPPSSGPSDRPQPFPATAVPQSSETSENGAVSWMKRHKVLTGIGAFVLIGIIGAAFSDEETAPTATESAPKALADAPSNEKAEAKVKAEPKAATTEKKVKKAAEPKSSEFGAYGPIQTRFVKAVLAGREAFESADNELQEGAAMTTRNDKVCKVIGDGQVAGWQGKVITLDSNGDGFGVVELEIADDVKVATWNNAFSDYADKTLIEPGPLYDRIITLSKGDIVTFDGQFMPSAEACVNDSAITKRGGTTSPDFIFKFSDITKVN